MLKHCIWLAILLFAFLQGTGQSYAIRGTISDSSSKKNLHRATVSVLRQKDSVLVRYGRTNPEGLFNLSLPDTGNYLLLISHPGYAEYTDRIRLADDGGLELGTVYLTLRSKLLEEIIIRKTIPAIRFKGDTMVLKADSFKVKPGATVEELLKQMPGFQVDKNGQITAQGERVQKVLVDGEEFFSDDPTIATKNLLANMVEDVEVFDKKSDQAEFTGIDDGSKTKTINLKIKEDKKNGYFGKVEGGTDFNQYWNNSAMVNSFKGKQKITGYGIMSNNGKTGLSWQENMNFGGLGGGLDTGTDENGGMFISFSNGGDEFNNSNFNGEGLPKSWSAGINFSDKWGGEASHLNGNLRYNKLNNEADIKTRTQYILPDTLFYQNQDNKVYNSRDRRRGEALYDMKLDSSSSIKVTVAGHKGNTLNQNIFNTESLTEEGNMVNNSNRVTTSEGDNEAFSSSLIYRKKFKKQGHTFSAQFRQDYKQQQSEGLLKALNSFFDQAGNPVNIDTIDQQKLNDHKSNAYSGTLSYTTPLSKRTYLEFNYGLSHAQSRSDRLTLEKTNPADEKYSDEVAGLTNIFDYTNSGNTGGINFRYNKPKKMNFSVGASVAQNSLLQQDLRRDTSLRLNFVNFFPRANLNITMKKNRNLRFYYNGSTQQPSIEQLQPVIDNTDPLNIAIGNPDLEVAVNHRLGAQFGGYDFLSESGFWSSLDASFTQQAFSTRDFVDSLGRRVFQTVNVSGVYNLNGYGNYNFKIRKKVNAGLGLNFNYGQNVNIVNGEENRVRNGNIGTNIYLGYNKEKKFNAWLSYEFNQNLSTSSINSGISTNYWLQTLNLEYTFILPWKLEYGGEISANFRQKTDVFTDNNNAILVSQFIDRKLMKNDQLRIRLYAFDIFNQNIGFRRNISTNLISERTFNTIQRYGMLSVIWNFNKNGKPMQF